MKIAWVSDRNIPEGQGGAEAADRDMLDARPEGTEITLVGPSGVGSDYLDEFDHIVVTGFYFFSSQELNEIARHDFVLWAHDVQMAEHWLYESAKTIVCLTEQHKDYQLDVNRQLNRGKIVLNPGTLSMANQCWPGDKEDFALWAHRDIAHKGEDLAHEWAKAKGVNLQVYKNVSREETIERMRVAKYFILLSHIFDPGPRSVMEAQLCGCDLILNDNVGYWDVHPETLRLMLENAASHFWEVVNE